MKKYISEDVKGYASKYVTEVFWSEEDNCFIGSLPELCGPCCHGDTPDKVKAQLQEIAEGYVEDKWSGEVYVPEPTR